MNLAHTPYTWKGHIESLKGLIISVDFGMRHAEIGSLCTIMTNPTVKGEIIGFDGPTALVMPYGSTSGMALDTPVILDSTPAAHIYPDARWIGRVMNGWCEPIDAKGPLTSGHISWPLLGDPISASKRQRVVEPLDVGVRAINTFLTVCKGQRMGLFAGTGVGKSMLMSMLARFTPYDVCIIGLIGERGREVNEFLDETLTEEARTKSIVVVATSDEPALMRRRASYLTLALSEYYRAQGLSVLCLFDSVTRFAYALRDIGLALGEPPTLRGYPPSVFAELPRLLERAGPGEIAHTTGFFSVLMEGDDRNDPITDAVRGIIDGHIVLDRNLADRAHFPAIHIGQSLSRLAPQAHTKEQEKIARWGRQQLALHDDMIDLIRIQAYTKGSNAEVDRAIDVHPQIMELLRQDWRERSQFIEGDFKALQKIMES